MFKKTLTAIIATFALFGAFAFANADTNSGKNEYSSQYEVCINNIRDKHKNWSKYECSNYASDWGEEHRDNSHYLQEMQNCEDITS